MSNHGGRQLDHGRGSLDVLPEVVATVAGRATIIVDGGFMRGTDVVKAIALGAHAVGVGRLECFGLAAAGAPGWCARWSSWRTRSASAWPCSGSLTSARSIARMSTTPRHR